MSDLFDKAKKLEEIYNNVKNNPDATKEAFENAKNTFEEAQSEAETLLKAGATLDSKDQLSAFGAQFSGTTAEAPMSQADLLKFRDENPHMLFGVEKISIDVKLTCATGGEPVKTTTLARDGRKIEETNNIAKRGFGIDTRTCINGQADQYAKKPGAVEKGYTINDGRSFEQLGDGETVDARTVGGEQRDAFVAPTDMWIGTAWGEPQFIAKGGLVTFMGDEAIGNNNPVDLVLRDGDRTGNVPLTRPAYEAKKDAEKTGLKTSVGLAEFYSIAGKEDAKNPYLNRGKDMQSTR